MNKQITLFLLILTFSLAATLEKAEGANKSEIDLESKAALEILYEKSPVARELQKTAKGILVFPKIVKAGFMFGGQSGDGALFKNGEPVDYYNSSAISYGLQVGVQTFGYALFFMTDEDLNYLEKSQGWEIGSGPTLVVGDQGVSGAFTTTTIQKGVQGFFFNQQGLMAGIGLQGTKITRIDK